MPSPPEACQVRVGGIPAAVTRRWPPEQPVPHGQCTRGRRQDHPEPQSSPKCDASPPHSLPHVPVGPMSTHATRQSGHAATVRPPPPSVCRRKRAAPDKTVLSRRSPPPSLLPDAPLQSPPCLPSHLL